MIERRQFLKTLGLAGSAAVLESSCGRRTSNELIPYFVEPDAVVAGAAAHYATVCRACPAGCGLIATVNNGRIIKAEGSPQHPIGGGRLCARGQASVQSVYNPYRFRQPLRRDSNGILQPVAWTDAVAELAAKLREAAARGRDRLAWIGRLETGPFDELVGSWLGAFNSTRRLAYETFDYHALRAAGEAAFGRAEIPRYDFDKADFVLAFGAEFLETWISNVEFTRGYSRLRARRQHDPSGAFVWVAPRLSLTGLNADAWLPVRPGAEAAAACAIAHVMIAENRIHPSAASIVSDVRSALERFTPDGIAAAAGTTAEGLRTAARRFARPGASIALGGGTAASGDVGLETAVLLLNALNGNVGSTVTFGAAHALDRVATHEDIHALVEAMSAGAIDVLLVHHSNPVYSLPPAAGFDAAIARVPFVVNFGSLQDETTDRAALVMPDHHDLESWGTYAPRAGITGSLQPAAQPLFDTRATADVLIDTAREAGVAIGGDVPPRDWRERLDEWWASSTTADRNEIVREGGVFAEAGPPAPVVFRGVSDAIRAISVPAGSPALAFIAFPTAHLFDGRDADVSWLQELPDPVQKTVWGNSVEMHPDAAARVGVADGDEVEVQSPHGRVTARARLYGGLHPGAVAMAIGYGRTASMRVAAGRGARASALLPSSSGPSAVWRVDEVTIRRAAGGRRLIVLQAETAAPSDGAPPAARLVSPARVDNRAPQPPQTVQFYPAHEHKEHRWGMAIDLNACTGCSACVVACYAENNIAVVGPDLCEQGREMSWIRVEREVHTLPSEEGLQTPGNVFLPMLCQQCDNAPCESVCPVYATYHNPEGLNAQVYVRCIGTRFCSNNCPYKVRRFNWGRYGWTAPLGEQLNPNVTVRSVGVMEKCTFCIQRIQAGKLEAKRAHRAPRDGEIVPACAQTCPADAIVFGDLHDPDSRVSQLSRAARGYRELEELNTKPAITYLRRVIPGAPEHDA
ncbi:MAG TPA: molybdopterin dinucleotide binding domain-containing protein [Vicinamibacterales bacterium]|nr:molybdopterin dinucleotide binding domain-containing protein [Vicinamibacterales bacterium]